VTGQSANGSRPFDLQAAADAAAAEAEGRPFVFAYAGKTYEVPVATAWPVSALRSLAEGNLDEALGVLLGPEAYDQLTEAGIKLGDLNVLFDKIAAESGLGSLPNSRAPAPRAGRPKSRRLCSRRTASTCSTRPPSRPAASPCSSTSYPRRPARPASNGRPRPRSSPRSSTK
jgi:hypothetical protein